MSTAQPFLVLTQNLKSKRIEGVYIAK